MEPTAQDLFRAFLSDDISASTKALNRLTRAGLLSQKATGAREGGLGLDVTITEAGRVLGLVWPDGGE